MPHSIDPGSYRSPDRQRPAVPLPIETEPRTHDPYAAFRFGDFALFTAGNLLSITGRLMLAVAVEWEIYARTHSATALGLVGLAIAVPVVTLSLPAGHLADRFSRKHIILWSQVLSAITSLALALVSYKHLLFHRSRRCVRAITPWLRLPAYSSAITRCSISTTHQFR
jgi:MFS family permease